MTNRPHWSYSALTQYLRCPRQYYFQRILGLKPAFTPSSLVLGSAVHEALAAYHRGVKDQKPPSTEDVRQVFAEAWQARNFREKVKMEKPVQAILDKGVAMLDAYLASVPPTNIVAVEHEIVAPIHNSQGEILEKPMTAIVDLLTQSDEALKITDLKTSSRSYSDFEATVSLQATCYVNAVAETFGKLATFEYAVLVKTKKPRLQRLVTTRTHEDLGRLGDLVQTIDRAIEAEIFYPIESALNCASCPFRKPCRERGADQNQVADRPSHKNGQTPPRRQGVAP